MESRFIQIPTTNQNPRLRFWHWFNFSCGDFGRVEIKAGAGPWLPLTNVASTSSAIFTGYSGGTWSYPSYDLRRYAGQMVQIGFYFESHNDACNAGISGNPVDVAPGWYIDELAVVTGPEVVLTNDVVEGFEGTNFWSDWSADNGTWERGHPTSGPGAAHERSNVVATILTGNYGDNTSSRLVSPAITIPASGQNPRLRFWHWFNLSCGDSGRVQIKVGSNIWETLSTFSGYSGGAWGYPSIDLSPYSQQTVRFGFYFESYNDACNAGISGNPVDVAPGWYIDELAVVTGPIVFTNPENLEQTNFWFNWVSDHGTWEFGRPGSGPNGAHEGSNVVGTILSGNYGDDTSSRLVSPPFVVPPASTQPRFRFWHWFNFNCGDWGRVQVLAGTNNWQTLSNATYTSTSGGVWTRPSIDLTQYAGQAVKLGFLFESRNDPCNAGISGNPVDVGPGWYIDEIRLLHDFALLIGSTVVRTQEIACVSMRAFASDPVTDLSFSLDANILGTSNNVSTAHLLNASLMTGDRFESVSVIPGIGSELLINLRTHPTNGVNGDQILGSLCVPSNLPHSALIALQPQNLIVTNANGSIPRALSLPGRAVIIANEPLLEAWMDTNQQRTVTTYGKPHTGYEIHYATNLVRDATWLLGMTNLVPGSMFISQPLIGVLETPAASNAPSLYLRANER